MSSSLGQSTFSNSVSKSFSLFDSFLLILFSRLSCLFSLAPFFSSGLYVFLLQGGLPLFLNQPEAFCLSVFYHSTGQPLYSTVQCIVNRVHLPQVRFLVSYVSNFFTMSTFFFPDPGTPLFQILFLSSHACVEASLLLYLWSLLQNFSFSSSWF
jgi:hypothetical protein